MNLPANGFRILALTLAVISSAAQVYFATRGEVEVYGLLK